MKKESYSETRDIYKFLRWKREKATLTYLDIELTERCNSHCIHCSINLPTNDISAQQKELSTIKLKRILKEAASLGAINVRFTGGEPLLRDDFKELYVFTRKLGMRVILFTNATLIDNDLIDLFVKIPLLQKIEVSLYGMKKDSYERVTRVDGSFERAWHGIQLLLENKIPFIIKGALLPSNKSEIGEFESWASGIPWMDGTPFYSMCFSLRCRPDQEKNRSIEKLRATPEEAEQLISRRGKDYVEEMKRKLARPVKIIASDKLFLCNMGLHEGCVDAYGKFQPCMGMRAPELVYDLRKGSLEDALKNFFPKIRELKSSNPEHFLRCGKCFLRRICLQCPALSWQENGTLDTPIEYYCSIAHTEARFLGLLKDGEFSWKVEDWDKRINKFIKQESISTTI